jgi:hypothetical protein
MICRTVRAAPLLALLRGQQASGDQRRRGRVVVAALPEVRVGAAEAVADVAHFAETYAHRNEHDLYALREAVASGRVIAETGL